MKVARERAALRRRALSRPLRRTLEDGIVGPTTSVLDFGCGYGDDVRYLAELGIHAVGWDPVLRPNVTLRPAAVVNLGYVLNVIEDQHERAETLRQAWEFAERVLVVSVRTVHERGDLQGKRVADGVLTRRRTFQKFFEPAEAMEMISSVLGTAAVAIAPGVFYVFRDDTAREAFVAARVCRAPRTVRVRLTPGEEFERNRDVLQPIVAFLETRGRFPTATEIGDASESIAPLGSFSRARRIVAHAIGAEVIEQAEVARTEDLLVYLALARFQRRPSFARLPADLQRDIRALFRSYDRACALADEVLLRAGRREDLDRAFTTSPVGKLTPTALYVHISALSELPPLLRIYEGCARNYVGIMDEANVVKLHRDAPAVSYLVYPRFERNAHPALAMSLLVGLQTLRVDRRDFRTSANPPILHRKETLVAENHPLRKLFKQLTIAEERAGLFDDPRTIGTRQQWETRLGQAGITIRGHRLLRS